MDAEAATPDAPIKKRFKLPSTFHLVIAFSIAAVSLVVLQATHFKAKRDIAHTRYRSHLGLMRLYDMQVAYRVKYGTYANSVDALLASAEDGPKLRANLKTVIDMETLVISGDAKRFRLEINILDPQRTPVKIRGPL